MNTKVVSDCDISQNNYQTSRVSVNWCSLIVDHLSYYYLSGFSSRADVRCDSGFSNTRS